MGGACHTEWLLIRELIFAFHQWNVVMVHNWCLSESLFLQSLSGTCIWYTRVPYWRAYFHIPSVGCVYDTQWMLIRYLILRFHRCKMSRYGTKLGDYPRVHCHIPLLKSAFNTWCMLIREPVSTFHPWDLYMVQNGRLSESPFSRYIHGMCVHGTLWIVNVETIVTFYRWDVSYHTQWELITELIVPFRACGA